MIHNSDEPLVSIDYKGTKYGCIIDHRWTDVTNNNRLKVVLWYDNEWGYSHQVVDIVKYLISKGLK